MEEQSKRVYHLDLGQIRKPVDQDRVVGMELAYQVVEEEVQFRVPLLKIRVLSQHQLLAREIVHPRKGLTTG
jgi:hypothetical protein